MFFHFKPWGILWVFCVARLEFPPFLSIFALTILRLLSTSSIKFSPVLQLKLFSHFLLSLLLDALRSLSRRAFSYESKSCILSIEQPIHSNLVSSNILLEYVFSLQVRELVLLIKKSLCWHWRMPNVLGCRVFGDVFVYCALLSEINFSPCLPLFNLFDLFDWCDSVYYKGLLTYV
jgi:hypothetical protein